MGVLFYFNFEEKKIWIFVLWFLTIFLVKWNKFKEEKKNIGITYVYKFTETCSNWRTNWEKMKEWQKKPKKNEIETEFTIMEWYSTQEICFFAPEKKNLFCKNYTKKSSQKNQLARRTMLFLSFFKIVHLFLIESNSHKPLIIHRNISTSMLMRNADSLTKMEHRTAAHCI